MNERDRAPRILFVEPHKGALGIMAGRLSACGYRIIACDSGGAAVAELHRAAVDLVIAELRMAGTSGVELVRLIRDDSVLKETPVILVTGRSDAAGAIDGFAAGADDVVAKPYDFEVLVARIERRLARARAVRELRDDNAALDARVVKRALELSALREELERVRSAA